MVILTKMYNITECPYECEYTTNKDLQMNASVIIFSIRNEHKKLPKSRSSKQLYVFCIHESPPYTYEYFKYNTNMLMRQYDWVFGMAERGTNQVRFFNIAAYTLEQLIHFSQL
uniref:Fucosyltransferase N-terminal domain-containing protein n=1 Tax=Meloidogyne floridensis TaxID=298350 RepID=A0A915PDC3_9BILA